MIKFGILMPMNQKNKNQGFTLIEILVAMLIFSILSVITSMALKKTITQYGALKDHYQHWQHLNHIIEKFNNQAYHLIQRPIKANDEHLFPVFIGQREYVEWTHNYTPLQTLERVAYLCKNNQLIERHWQALDPIDRNAFHDTILLKDLDECHFRYLFPNRDIQAVWQPNRFSPSPRGIQMMLTFSNQQNLELWFALPPFVYDIPQN